MKIIDADMEQARAAMVAGCRTIQDGPFADVEPFDPLYPDVKFLSGRYKNPEMVREAVRRLAAALRSEAAQLNNATTKATA